jgi:hypothetical protein
MNVGLGRRAKVTTTMGVTSMRHEEAVDSSLISRKKFLGICRFVKIIFKITYLLTVATAYRHDITSKHNFRFLFTFHFKGMFYSMVQGVTWKCRLSMLISIFYLF